MKHSLLLLPFALLVGCGAMQLPVDNRTPEQIAASAKDKAATVDCTVITSVYAMVRNIRIAVDKSSLGTNGASVTGDPIDCKAAIQILPKQGTPASAP